MKRLVQIFVTTILYFVFTGNILSQNESVEDNDYLFEIESTFSSKYVWRGLIYNEGLVFQPSVSVTKNNWGAQIWNNWTFHDINHNPFQNEIDFYLWYNLQFGELTISPIVIYYTYPGQDAESTGGIGFSLFYPIDNLELSTSVNMDFKEIAGGFSFQHDIAYNKSISDNLNVILLLSVGWADKKFNNYYIGIEKLTANYFQTNFSFKYTLSENYSVKPFAEYFRILDPGISEIINHSFFNTGISFYLEF